MTLFFIEVQNRMIYLFSTIFNASRNILKAHKRTQHKVKNPSKLNKQFIHFLCFLRFSPRLQTQPPQKMSTSGAALDGCQAAPWPLTSVLGVSRPCSSPHVCHAAPHVEQSKPNWIRRSGFPRPRVRRASEKEKNPATKASVSPSVAGHSAAGR